jgi:hypothetical protein
MKVTSLRIYLILFLSSLWCSCKKKEDVINLGSQAKFTLLDANALQNTTWKGIFSVIDGQRVSQEYETGQDWHRGNVFVAAQGYKDVSQLPPAQINGISVQIPDMRAGAQPNQLEFTNRDLQADNLFGQTVDINAFGIVGKMYIPKKIRLAAPKPDNTVPDLAGGTPVKRANGISLKWNADLNNKRGILLEIHHSLPQGGFQKTIRVLDDTGDFTLSNDLLSHIPKDARIELTLLRGNYQIGDNKEDLIMCLSTVKSIYKLLD